MQAPIAIVSGEQLLARSKRLFLLTLIFATPSALLAWQLAPLWSHIAALDGATFLGAATAFGLGLIVLPLGALICFVSALYWRVESNILPGRQRPANTADIVSACAAVLASLLPAAWPASKAARALITGSITIRQPIEHHFSIASDPLVFWENVTYWLLASVALAALSAYFWRSRWLAYRQRDIVSKSESSAPRR